MQVQGVGGSFVDMFSCSTINVAVAAVRPSDGVRTLGALVGCLLVCPQVGPEPLSVCWLRLAGLTWSMAWQGARSHAAGLSRLGLNVKHARWCLVAVLAVLTCKCDGEPLS